MSNKNKQPQQHQASFPYEQCVPLAKLYKKEKTLKRFSYASPLLNTILENRKLLSTLINEDILSDLVIGLDIISKFKYTE